MRKLGWVMPLAICVLAAAQERPRPNLLLITLDAVRADRESAKLAPNLSSLAARGTRFERAYTHAPLTLPSHVSILTGLLPPAHGVRNNGFRLDGMVTTLAELLGDAGYRTGAFVGSSALDARFGLSQGFEEYDDRYDPVQAPSGAAAFRQGARAGAAVASAASAWIARTGQPWFAWVHLRDAHAPYVAYDHAVAAADAAVGAVLSARSIAGVLDRTLVVVTADHGEALGEHGERTHGLFAYEGTMRVPLILAGPGVPQRVVRTPAAAHVDIAPTVLDLVGVTGRAFDGRTLVPSLKGATLPDASIYFEALDAALMRGAAALTGILAERWKYIDLPLPELYDIEADPGERRNLAAGDPVRAMRMRDATVQARTRSPLADPAATLAEPEARARLRSLGYVGSASWRLGATRVDDDPKRLLPLHLAYEAAIELAAVDAERAIGQLRLIVEQRPDFAAAVDALGALLLAGGKAREAATLLTEALAGGLRHRVLVERLGAALLALKDARAARGVLQPLVDADGDAVNARFLLARALAATGDPASAALHLQAALRVDPTFAAAADLLERIRERRD